jgi:hypothetical protein
MTIIERQNKAIQNLYGCGNAVGNIGRSLSSVGLDKLAEKLFRLAEEITFSTEEVQKTQMEDLQEQVKRQANSSINMLNAALAGAELKKRSKGESKQARRDN